MCLRMSISDPNDSEDAETQVTETLDISDQQRVILYEGLIKTVFDMRRIGAEAFIDKGSGRALVLLAGKEPQNHHLFNKAFVKVYGYAKVNRM